MFCLRSAGKSLVYSKCGCMPNVSMKTTSKGLYLVQSVNSQSTWEYIKEKLGLQKKKGKSAMPDHIDSRYLEPETIPVHSNTTEEMWKPGYRGRTENKRY